VHITPTSLYSDTQSRLDAAPYFRECLSAADLDALNIEIIRNTLYKAYFEDFHNFCNSLDSPTSDIMHQILAFEADRRAINITINSFGTDLSKERRAKLFPTIGRLYPDGNNALARADDFDQVRQACEYIPEYRGFFESSHQTHSAQNGENGVDGLDDLSSASQLEDRFFMQEVHLNKLAFLQQFSYAVFYSYIKLKEQEIRSLTWIAECIAQNNRERIGEYIATF
jgi:V-type H+-transporting ATPase subunit d